MPSGASGAEGWNTGQATGAVGISAPSASAGLATPEFAEVRELFDSFLADDPGYSAQLSVYRRGTKVVDLCGGPGLAPGDITGTYSCSKGVAAFVIALLVQDGRLDLDRTVASYWPEFGVQGKDRLTVRQALSHQAGLPGVVGGFPLAEFATADAARRLAASAPLWCPGTAFGYHALTMGILMEELCRRTSGMPLQGLYDRRIRHPWGIDFFLGLPEDQEPRYRDVLYDPAPAQPWTDPLSLDGLGSNAPGSTIMELPNHRVVRASGMSSAGGVGSAEGLARLSGSDNAFAVVFMKPQPGRNFGSHLAFGHEGASAALGFADPGYGLGFGYVPRRSEEGRTGGRAQRLSAAVRRAAHAAS